MSPFARKAGIRLPPGFLVNCVLLIACLSTVCVSSVLSDASEVDLTLSKDDKPADKRVEAQKGIRYPPCKACSHLVDSFQKVSDNLVVHRDSSVLLP
jgi:hypothetical protein